MAAHATALGATALAGLFEGCAAYVMFGDPVPYYHREEEDTNELLRDWRRMFLPAAKMQGALCALGALTSGAAAYLNGGGAAGTDVATAFGVAAACQVSIWAYTMVALMPVNRTLLPKGGVEGSKSSGEVRELLKSWGRMHAVRVALGAAALGGCLWGLKLMLEPAGTAAVCRRLRQLGDNSTKLFATLFHHYTTIQQADNFLLWLSANRHRLRVVRLGQQLEVEVGQLLRVAALETSVLSLAATPQVLALELSAFCPVALGGWFGALRALRNLVVASPLIALPLQLSQLAALTSITLSAKTGNDYHELTNDVHFEVPAILMPPGCLPTGLRVLRLFDHATALPEAVLVASQLSYLSVGSGSLSHNYNCSGLEGLTALRTLVVDTCSGGAPPQLTALTGLECLSLNYCRFDQPEERPLEVVTALTRLRELSVSRAELRALPQEVLQLPQLTYLNLSSNPGLAGSPLPEGTAWGRLQELSIDAKVAAANLGTLGRATSLVVLHLGTLDERAEEEAGGGEEGEQGAEAAAGEELGGVEGAAGEPAQGGGFPPAGPGGLGFDVAALQAQLHQLALENNIQTPPLQLHELVAAAAQQAAAQAAQAAEAAAEAAPPPAAAPAAPAAAQQVARVDWSALLGAVARLPALLMLYIDREEAAQPELGTAIRELACQRPDLELYGMYFWKPHGMRAQHWDYVPDE